MSDSTLSTTVTQRGASAWAAPLALAILGFGAAACSSTNSSASLESNGSGASGAAALTGQNELPPLAQPTSEVATRISVKAYEVQAIRSNDDWIRLSEWFHSQDELAYAKLLEMAAGSHTGAKEFAMGIISARGDSRLLPYFLRDVPVPSPDDFNVHLGYHRALLAMGETSSIPVLIDGMQDSNWKKRNLAHRALKLATRAGIPFDAQGTPEERAESVQAWRDWYQAQANDPMLQK